MSHLFEGTRNCMDNERRTGIVIARLKEVIAHPPRTCLIPSPYLSDIENVFIFRVREIRWGSQIHMLQ